MKKRFFTIILAAVVLLLAALPGCSGEKKPGPTTSPVFTSPPMPTQDPHEGEIEVEKAGGGTMWVPEAPSLTAFGKSSSSFDVVDQIPYYNGEDLTMRRGIDVSDHQRDIDWRQVADYGIDFAIIRCGWRSYDQGGSVNEDSRFREYIEGALAAGLEVGVYFFSQALNIVEAAEEAVFTLHLIESYDITLPVFFDWEPMPYDGSRSADVDGQVVTACCLEFCKLVQAMGYQPGMYSYNMLAYSTYELDQLEGITLWMGDPGTKPIFYFDHDFWQYSYTGAVPGIGVDVDLDALYIRDGVAPSYPHPSPKPTPAPTPVPSPTPPQEVANG